MRLRILSFVFEWGEGAFSKVCCGVFEFGVELKSGLKEFSFKEWEDFLDEEREKSESSNEVEVLTNSAELKFGMPH